MSRRASITTRLSKSLQTDNVADAVQVYYKFLKRFKKRKGEGVGRSRSLDRP